MKQTTSKILTVSVALLFSGAMAMAQQRPMASAPQQQQQQENPNPGLNSPTMQRQNTMQQQNQAMQQMQDKAFVRKAMEGSMAEVKLGQLAQQKSNSPDLKQFGEKMQQDHSQLNDQMKPIAQQLGVEPPQKISKKDEKLDAKLQNMSGTQFNDAYIKAMVKDHEDDLQEFRREAQNTQNPQLKQAAQQGEQVIEQHLALIKQIAKDHGVKA